MIILSFTACEKKYTSFEDTKKYDDTVYLTFLSTDWGSNINQTFKALGIDKKDAKNEQADPKNNRETYSSTIIFDDEPLEIGLTFDLYGDNDPVFSEVTFIIKDQAMRDKLDKAKTNSAITDEKVLAIANENKINDDIIKLRRLNAVLYKEGSDINLYDDYTDEKFRESCIATMEQATPRESAF